MNDGGNSLCLLGEKTEELAFMNFQGFMGFQYKRRGDRDFSTEH